MTPIEEADEQMAQFLKDYPTYENLKNSIKNGYWEEIKGGWSDLENKMNWNPILDNYSEGVLYIVWEVKIGGGGENVGPSSIGQCYNFGAVRESDYTGNNSNHRHMNFAGLSRKMPVAPLYYDYEELDSGGWGVNQRFFLYAPSKWPLINWKGNPFEVKS